MKITINAGHCPGEDSGAVGATGLQEADIVKKIMEKLAPFLESFGYEVNQVQENELYQITDSSNEFESDIFISIHCNAADNTEAEGTETFHYYGSAEGAKLAECIQNKMITFLNTVDRGVKEAGFYVLKNTDCVAVLVETAFISNPKEEELLGNDDFITKIAMAIANGIEKYISGQS